MSENIGKLAYSKQIEAETSLYKALRSENSNELRELGFGEMFQDELGVKPGEMAELYVITRPIGGEETDDLKQVVVRARLLGHSSTNAANVSFKEIEVGTGYQGSYAPRKDIEFGKQVAFLGAINMAKGLEEAQTSGVLQHLSGDLGRVEIKRDDEAYGRQIKQERSLLATFKEQNDKELRAAGLEDQFPIEADESIHIAELAVDIDNIGDPVQVLSILAKITDPDNPNFTAYRLKPVAEIYQGMVLPLEDSTITIEQAMIMADQVRILQHAKATGLMPHLASNLHQIDDTRDGKILFPAKPSANH